MSDVPMVGARPAALVSVVCAAWGEAWGVMGLRAPLARVLCAVAEDRARDALDGAHERPVQQALKAANTEVTSAFRDLMRKHGFFDDTVNRATAKVCEILAEVRDTLDEAPEQFTPPSPSRAPRPHTSQT